MPLLLDTAQSRSAAEFDAANCITVGLVNNMPDAALAATERQFVELLRAGARRVAVRVVLLSIPEVPRAEASRREMSGRYRAVGGLWNGRLDGLIVTGTEPRAKNLTDEPYWGAMAQLIDWAREHTYSTIWSCLAAHAAVHRSDGIERTPLPEKLSGVFACGPESPHPIVRGATRPLRVPHSRGNDLSADALKSCGYRLLSRSVESGVDMFARQERSFHLFFQGHPEYEADTLLREYRRDVGRYLRGEREHYPEMPRGYFDAAAAAAAEAFRARALAGRRGDLIADFPVDELQAGLGDHWRPTAVAIYENWLDYLSGRKADRRPPTPMRRAWRDWPAAPVRQAADGRAI